MPSRLTTEDFIKKSKIKHGEKWDYSKTHYNGSKKKLVIICKIHGEFLQNASDHLSGCGCPDCDPTKRIGSSDFVTRARLVHGDKFDYSKVIYGKNNYELVEIICKTHGSFFQRPWGHLRGQGCPRCKNSVMITNKDFIIRCKEKHGDKFDYSMTFYSGRRKPIDIICKKHGLFKQEARLHLDGWGCRKCKNSRLEDLLSMGLSEINEPYERDKKFIDCRNINPLPFDFYLPLRNQLIECDGIQHRESVPYFGGIERLESQIINDNIKNNWCEKNSIRLIRLSSEDEIKNFIENLKENKIVFNKSSIKDLSSDRTQPKKPVGNYLLKTDFNWFRKENIKDQIEEFIISLNIIYLKNQNLYGNIIDWVIGNNCILLIDNFRDSEINKRNDWLVKLKDKLEDDNKNLIIIYPEDWISKKCIVKSRISNTLQKNTVNIGARNCKIIIPDNKTTKDFLMENHIQGHVNSSIKIALKYGDEVVSLMTFGKLRKNLGNKSKNDCYEMLRFCNKKGTTVMGSANKLMKYFNLNFNPKIVISYADRCWTTIHKNIYQELGFNLVGKTQPSYCYLVGEKKYDRFRYRKDKLIEFGYDVNSWTERKICGSNLIFRIYDAGCLKYELRNDNIN